MKRGDVFDISSDSVRHSPGGSTIAFTRNDDRDLRHFDPTAPIPELMDPNPEGRSMTDLAAVTERLIIDSLGSLASNSTGGCNEEAVIRLYRKYHVRYAIGLVFPN